MSDDIFNLDEFVSQEPVVKKASAVEEYDNNQFTS